MPSDEEAEHNCAYVMTSQVSAKMIWGASARVSNVYLIE
jgi:hypothetical protein